MLRGSLIFKSYELRHSLQNSILSLAPYYHCPYSIFLQRRLFLFDFRADRDPSERLRKCILLAMVPGAGLGFPTK